MSSAAESSTDADDVFPCPTCDDEFDTRRGMRVHHARIHDESLVETETCEHCGEEFTPNPGTRGRFCSSECMGQAKRTRVTLTCEHCDEAFEVRPCEADQTYCSLECYGAAREASLDRRECVMCGRVFRVAPSRDTACCSTACRDERRTSKPRPPSVPALLWLLYVYEDRSQTQTYRRQRAVLGHEECLTNDEVRERLVEMGVYDPTGQARRALEAADPDDFGRERPEGDDAWQDVWQEGGRP